MINFRYNLRSHISRRPTKSVDCLFLFAAKTETKINQFQLFVPINENILCFDISMNNI